MTQYSELMSQAKALMDQAEQIRKQERISVIEEIRAWMTEYNITADELSVACNPKVGKSKAPAKYQGPNGQL